MSDIIKNRYRIEQLIGQGGMGTVHKAYDRLTGDTVALKQVTIPHQNFDILTQASETVSERMALANEFRTLASLRHPHIISVLDYGFDDNNNPFYTMEWIENGIQIREHATGKSREQKIDYLLNILQALRYLHQRGILHRDLKPANILVSDDTPKLLDFGLAVDANYAREHSDAAGTLAYLAPEILRGVAPSIQSDLYAFAVVAYEIFTGEHPFPYETQSELLQQLLLELPNFTEHKLDEDIQTVILRLLSKSPEDRYSTALDTIRALCDATNHPLPLETVEIRDSFLVASSFVGREDEISILTNALKKMLDNAGQRYLIGGESGVGKTRLMDELRAQALVEGVTVVRGQAVTEAGLPYKIWRDILPELLLLTDIADDEVAILASLIPDIATLLEREVTASTLSESAIHARLPLIITNLIVEAAKQTPLLIMLEDLQWASDSIDFLEQVNIGIEHHAVMIAGNYRSDEAPHLKQDLQSMNHMLLNRLSEADIKELSIAMLGRTGNTPGVVDLINRESEGNAFFIVEVVRALAEEVGHLSNIGKATLPTNIFTGGIHKIIQRHMAKLPGWALHPLQLSAIIGRKINPDVISSILPDLDVEKWLTTCGEVAVFSASGNEWQFTHDKMREYILSNLEQYQEQVITLQVAEAIESYYADDLDAYAPVLAEYYRTAGKIEKESIYAIKAILTLRYFEPGRAHQFAKRALSIKAHEYHDNPGQEWARLNMLFGKTAMQVNEYELSRESLETAISAYQAVDDEFGVAMATNLIGELGFKTGKFNEAIDLLNDCLPVLEKYDNWEEVGFVYMNLSIIHAQQGNMDIALPYFIKCKDAMEKSKDDVSMAKAYNNLAIAYQTTDNLEKGIEIHHKALAIRRRIQDRQGLAYSLTNLGAIEQQKGNFETARSMQLEALKYIREAGNPHAEVSILNNLAQTEEAAGKIAEAISYLNEALQVAKRQNDSMRISNTLLTLGVFYLKEDKQQAMDYFFEGVPITRTLEIIPEKIAYINRLSSLLAEFNHISDEERLEWLASTINYKKNFNNFDSIQTQLDEIKANIPAPDYEAIVQRGQSHQLNDVLDLIITKRESNEHDD